MGFQIKRGLHIIGTHLFLKVLIKTLKPKSVPFYRVANQGLTIQDRDFAKEKIFRHNVFKMLLSKSRITKDLVDMLMSWLPARRAYSSERPEADSQIPSYEDYLYPVVAKDRPSNITYPDQTDMIRNPSNT